MSTSVVTLARAELLKLRTTRITWWLVATTVLLTVVFTALIAGLAGQQAAGVALSPSEPATLRTIYGVGFSNGYLVALVIGVLGMAGEYRHRTITPTFLAAPRRGRLMVGKWVAYLVAGAAIGVLATAAAVAAGATVLAVRGYGTGLTADGVPRTLALSVLGVAIWTLFGLGLGTLISNQIAAIVVALASQLFVESLLSFGLNAIPHGGDVAKFLPSSAASAMVDGGSPGGGFSIALLPWWGGALTLAGWGLLFAVLGLLVTTRRDVT